MFPAHSIVIISRAYWLRYNQLSTDTWKLFEKHTERFSKLVDMGILAFGEMINVIVMYVASIYNGFPTDANATN